MVESWVLRSRGLRCRSEVRCFDVDGEPVWADIVDPCNSEVNVALPGVPDTIPTACEVLLSETECPLPPEAAFAGLLAALECVILPPAAGESMFGDPEPMLVPLAGVEAELLAQSSGIEPPSLMSSAIDSS